VDGPVYLYGFSSGSVLALKAAAQLGRKVTRLALLEPPLNADDDASKQEFKEFTEHMAELLRAGRRGDAVAFFLADMLPPEVLEGMNRSPEWKLMEPVPPTLAYDNMVMGDGSVPTEAAKAAADALAAAMPHAERKTLEGHATLVPPAVLATVLRQFFTTG
jgi:pimeloyl-ACP methyl ester carboxylesterase